VIVILAVAAGGFAASCVLGWGLVVAGLRAGDHPGDASAAAVLVPGPRPVIVATVRNPGDVPLLAGLTVRRRQWLAGWLDAGHTVRVPRRTARRKYLPGAQDTVGVVPAGEQAQFRVAASGAGGRLRVIGVPVVSGGPAGAGRPAPAARAWDRD
jgi:hypothetical protein